MKRFLRNTFFTISLLVFIICSTSVCYGGTWEFGTDAKGAKPFSPRGFLIETSEGVHWLSSYYDNSNNSVSYSGKRNGLDYFDVSSENAKDYIIYALTDRNPWPSDTTKISYGKVYLYAYKDGQRISNFASYVETPPVRTSNIDPSGSGTSWVFKIKGFKLEPGSQYEFGFYQGMQANNGITLVLAEAPDGNYGGYIQEGAEGLSGEEIERYNEFKYQEYEFVSTWNKLSTGGYSVNTVPMRYSLQTYADTNAWQNEANKVQQFINSVTEDDLKSGKYRRSNIDDLKTILQDQKNAIKNQVRYLLQPSANSQMTGMIETLNTALNKAQSDKPAAADLTELNKTLEEAESLYDTASKNIGTEKGQYGRIEVLELQDEISEAKKLDKFSEQTAINKEVRILKSKINEVKNSKVTVPKKVFKDKATGIIVTVDEDSLPENAVLHVQRKGTETEEYKQIKNKLDSDNPQAAYYVIRFFSGDQEINPSTEAEIQMPISIKIKKGTEAIFSVENEGKLLSIASVKSGEYIYFHTNEIGAFVLAGDNTKAAGTKSSKKNKDSTRQDNGDNKDNNKTEEITKVKDKNTEINDPIEKLQMHLEDDTSFEQDVLRDSNSIYAVYIAIALAILGLISGIRAWRRK